MKRHLFLAFVLTSITVFAQDDPKPSPLTISGYLETYYIYDFNKPADNTRPPFIYSFNRHNEVNVNISYLKAAYTTETVRANIAVMAGTYPNANLAAEPGVLKNIYEANAGVKISATKNLWVDAGIFGSHIGFESAVGKDCWNLTRSISTDNTPYYNTGVKISYTSDNEKWFLSGLFLNGWQRMQRVDGNSLPSFGTQATFKPTDKITLNSSSFIGTDKPDSARLMRYYHNFYGIFQVSNRLGLIIGFDYGVEEKNPDTSSTNAWLSPLIIARFTVTEKLTLAARAEYYQDEYGIFIATDTPNGFKTTGLSLNLDYQVNPNALWRLEVRNFHSKDKVFEDDGSVSNSDTFIGTSLAVSF